LSFAGARSAKVGAEYAASAAEVKAGVGNDFFCAAIAATEPVRDSVVVAMRKAENEPS